MPSPSLTEDQWSKIRRLMDLPDYHYLDYVPHQPVAESFLALEYYLERNYFPRALDRYSFVCLIVLFTWADYVDIVPGRTDGDYEYPPVVIESFGDGIGPEEVDQLMRSTLSSELYSVSYIFLEQRDLLIVLREDFSVVFHGLSAEDAKLIGSLASINGLFLKHRSEDGPATLVQA